MIRSDAYVRLGVPVFDGKSVTFDGAGSTNNRTLGSFVSDLTIDGIIVTLRIHVVADSVLNCDLLLGGELSDFVEITFKRRQATLSEIKEHEKLSSAHEDPNYDSTVVSMAEVLRINIPLEKEIDVRVEHVEDPTLKNKIRQLLEEYRPVGTADSGVRMRIILKDDVPTFQNPRRLSETQRAVVNDIVEKWIQDGVVRYSISDYASPIVLTTRKNGEPRLCVDYRQLNKKVIRDRHPLPLIEDQLDRLQGANVFSTLDLRDGFFHVPIEEESRKYTAFVTPDGQYEFLVTPFGFCNSPAVFQRHIRAVFRDLLSDGTVSTYLDDIIIPSEDEIENLEKLSRVLEVASKFGLRLNWSKCNFLVRTVEYLGYRIEGGTIRPSEKKTLAVTNFPTPKIIKDVQSFLGLVGYFRKFIPKFAVIARPLTQLLRDDIKFQFGAEEEHSFDQLKMALVSEPVLKLYRSGAETELHTDASKYGLGAVLLQRDSEDGLMHPIHYASWKTTPTEEKYISYELEVLAIIKSIKKFRVYLLGNKFKIVTDCKSFATTMSKKDSSLRVSHWALQLEEFQFSVEHRAGTAMRHADALSRNPVSVYMVQEDHDSLVTKIQREQVKDSELSKIMKSTKAQQEKGFLLRRGVLYRDYEGSMLLVVPNSMLHEVIYQAHDRGHFGWKKTEHILKQDFWFPKMRERIQKFISCCVKCILAEKKHGKVEGVLNPIVKGELPFDTYHIDHMGPIPSTKKNYNHLFVVIDAFSKFTWLYPVKSTSTEDALVRLRKQAAVFGNPRRIIADRGSAFRSNAFKEYCVEENIELVLITTGVPRGNGQVERSNRIAIPVLTKLSMPNPSEWHKHVDRVQQCINSTYSRSLKMTPFELLVGRKMQLKDDQELRKLIEDEIVNAYMEERINLRSTARDNIERIQEENRKTSARKTKEAAKYDAGDLVAIQRTQFGPGLKLHPKFLGPYKISRVLRNDRYLVEKEGDHEGPAKTSTSADHMKEWPTPFNSDWDSDSEEDTFTNLNDIEDDDLAGWPSVGSTPLVI